MIATVSPLERGGGEIEVHVRHGAKTAALDEHRLLVEHFGGLQHLAGGGEHCRPGQPELHEPQTHRAIIDVTELIARKVDEVDLAALGAQAVEQRFDEPLGLVVEKTRAVDQIHADDTERFLLRRVLDVEHAHVDHDLMLRATGARLKLNPHPTVTLGVTAKTTRGNRIREREERSVVAATLFAIVPAAPPAIKNQRTTSCPAPISAKVP